MKKHKESIIYAKEETVVKVKRVTHINGPESPLVIMIQYWTKEGKLITEGRCSQFDESVMNS